jgi:type IX secretion system PorP/SprF family membrane protein
MKKINNFFAILIIVFSGFVARAQDIHFSQIFETPLFLSPANTGFFNGYVRSNINYRNQWASMGNAFRTMAISVDGGLFRLKKRPAFMGMGLTLYSDQAGVARMRKTVAMFNVSALIKIGRNSALSVGLAGGSSSTNGDYTKLTYESQFNGNYINPSALSNEPIYRQYTTVDVATGIAYEFASYKRDQDHDDVTSFKLSFGAYHLNRAKEEYGPGSSYRLPVRYVGAITSVLDIEDTKFTVTPAVVYQAQGNFKELMMGTFVKFRMKTGTKVTGEKTQNAIGIGMFYRNKDALVPKLAVDFGDYSFGISYDVNLSNYRNASNYMGGFEVALRYNMLASSLFESKREYR